MASQLAGPGPYHPANTEDLAKTEALEPLNPPEALEPLTLPEATSPLIAPLAVPEAVAPDADTALPAKDVAIASDAPTSAVTPPTEDLPPAVEEAPPERAAVPATPSDSTSEAEALGASGTRPLETTPAAPDPADPQQPDSQAPADVPQPGAEPEMPVTPLLQLDRPRVIPPAPSIAGLPEAETAPEMVEAPPPPLAILPPVLPPEAEALLLPQPPPELGTQIGPQIGEQALPVPDPQAPATGGQPDDGLPRPADGVITNRLPSISGAGGDADPAADPARDSGTDAPVLALDPVLSLDPAAEADLSPLRRYARPFDNSAQKPLFAILLVDDGTADLNRAELALLELPLSIVIDPLSDGAAERAAIWRSGGQEVVMAGSGIPQGAGPGDLEQSMQVLQERLPESVAVVDVDGRQFQNNRVLAAQIVPILAEQGRGVLTLDQGLNAADQQARRDNLPAATIFRLLDAEDESAPVILRYLDRAAFKAAQDGEVAVIGRLRAETIEGILQWAVEGRAGTVAIAPASALLLR